MLGHIVKRFEWPLVRKELYKCSPFGQFTNLVDHRMSGSRYTTQQLSSGVFNDGAHNGEYYEYTEQLGSRCRLFNIKEVLMLILVPFFYIQVFVITKSSISQCVNSIIVLGK